MIGLRRTGGQNEEKNTTNNIIVYNVNISISVTAFY